MIRPIRPDDKGMLSDGLRRLSPQSAQRRFLTPKRSFSRAELRYLTEVDGRDHVALVAEYPVDPIRRLIAVARFVRLHDDPEAAEIAVTVADEWQGRGLGSLLGKHLAHAARNRNIRRFIHELETAPEFLVLENVELTQSEAENRGLNVNLQIATYFRANNGG